MSVIAGDPHRLFTIPTAQHARKRRLRTGEVHDFGEPEAAPIPFRRSRKDDERSSA
jgi:hypothetical protein